MKECKVKVFFSRGKGLLVKYYCPFCGIEVKTHFLETGRSDLHVHDYTGFICFNHGKCNCGQEVSTSRDMSWTETTGLSVAAIFGKEELPAWVKVVD